MANLVAAWLPALDGVVDKLRRGASVVDVGCGHGASTILMSAAFPASAFLGVDYHEASIRVAGRRASDAGVHGRTRFAALDATELDAASYDLVTMFDCLHDMGDPVAAARAALRALKPDGTLMLVEPAAGDHIEDNLHPLGRVYYGASTLICTPCSLAQPGGVAIGTQAGPARLTQVLTEAGFGSIRIACESPINLVIEARP